MAIPYAIMYSYCLKTAYGETETNGGRERKIVYYAELSSPNKLINKVEDLVSDIIIDRRKKWLINNYIGFNL